MNGMAVLNMAQDRLKSSPFGWLTMLPLELRLHIYSYVVPDNYSQTSQIEQYSVRPPLLPSKFEPIGLLYASKCVHDEAVGALATTRICQIIITHHGLIANTPLRDSALDDKNSDEVVIPTCEVL